MADPAPVNVNDNTDNSDNEDNGVITSDIPKSFINLTHNAFTLPEEGKYYNLTTSRVIGNVDDLVGFDSPNVVASCWEHVIQFCDINGIDCDTIVYMNEGDETQYGIIYDDYFAIECVREYDNSIGLDEIDDETIDSLLPFSFRNMSSYCRVTKVKDADTFEIILFADTSTISGPFYGTYNRKVSLCTNSYVYGDGDDKMLIKLNVRLFGIDAAESNTKPGQAAKKYIKSLLSSFENICYARFHGNDSRGRPLVRLYKDDYLDFSINNAILSYVDPQYGHLAIPYFGGTKNSEFKTITKAGGYYINSVNDEGDNSDNDDANEGTSRVIDDTPDDTPDEIEHEDSNSSHRSNDSDATVDAIIHTTGDDEHAVDIDDDLNHEDDANTTRWYWPFG
jgi:endonuclease YncB( thermonuclease family)